MKITDISSAPIEKEERDAEEKDENPRQIKRTLLKRYNIPVEHLDFGYVKQCTDVREIERILRILRSGEEGIFPELQQCVEDRLGKLHPNSRMFRVETPAMRTRELDREERDDIQNGLEEWLDIVTRQSSVYSNQEKSAEIFSSEKDILHDCPLPVRGSVEAHIAQELRQGTHGGTKTNKKRDDTRIKSWEYDKWDKYDVNAELTKLDITDLQREEWERRERPKLMEEQRKIEKLMKSSPEEDPSNFIDTSGKVIPESKRPSSSAKSPPKLEKIQSKQNAPASQQHRQNNKSFEAMSAERASYIEEIIDSDDEAGEQVNTSAVFAACGTRRTTVVIEDLNLPMI